jgi:hypothetical protein
VSATREAPWRDRLAQQRVTFAYDADGPVTKHHLRADLWSMRADRTDIEVDRPVAKRVVILGGLAEETQPDARGGPLQARRQRGLKSRGSG